MSTPEEKRCEDVAEFLGVPLTQTVKAIAIMRIPEVEEKSRFALILLRGDHELNEVKAQKIVGDFRFAREDEVIASLGCPPGYLGPVGIDGIPVFADRGVAVMSDFV